MDIIPEAPSGYLHRFLPPGQTDSDVHRHVCLAVVHTGTQGKKERGIQGNFTNMLHVVYDIFACITIWECVEEERNIIHVLENNCNDFDLLTTNPI